MLFSLRYRALTKLIMFLENRRRGLYPRISRLESTTVNVTFPSHVLDEMREELRDLYPNPEHISTEESIVQFVGEGLARRRQMNSWIRAAVRAPEKTEYNDDET